MLLIKGPLNSEFCVFGLCSVLCSGGGLRTFSEFDIGVINFSYVCEDLWGLFLVEIVKERKERE